MGEILALSTPAGKGSVVRLAVVVILERAFGEGKETVGTAGMLALLGRSLRPAGTLVQLGFHRARTQFYRENTVRGP
jgi:hypothetical protein